MFLLKLSGIQIRICRFLNKSDDYLDLYIRNLENSRLKPVFGTQYTFVFVLVGWDYEMDIVLSKKVC